MSTLFFILLLMSSSFSNVVHHHDVVVLCLADVIDVVVGKRETRKARDERVTREECARETRER